MFWRLIPAYGLLLLAAVSVLGLTLAHHSADFELHRLEEGLLARARLVRELVQDRPLDRLEALLVQLVKEQPGEVRITLISPEGKVLADSEREPDQLEDHGRRPEIVAARANGVGSDIRHSRSVNRDLLYVAIRADLKDARIAFVRIADSPGAVRSFVSSLNRIVAITLLVTAVLTVVVTMLMARRISRPIEEVAQGAENIAAGQFGRKVHTSAHGEVARLARSFNFMSDRLAAQLSKLEEDQEQLRAILGGMVEGVIALDAEQRILFANERAAHLLEFAGAGPAGAEAVGRRIWDVVRQRPLLDLLQRALNRKEAQQEEVTLYGRASRSLTVYAVRLPGDPPRGAILVLHDTSELRRLERLRQDFVANVSHELKTPLTVIKACVETLLEPGTLDDEPQSRSFLEQVADQGERLHRLILDLLSLAKIESGGETFVFQTVPVADVALSCLDRQRPRAESKGQVLELSGEPDELTAWVDEEALAEVLENLIDNAVKYTPGGGAIRLRWWSEKEWVCIEVKDNGIGIPAPDLPRIFERFYRVDKARSRELGGTGLGLSIVKHLVQAMSGTIAATSQVGQGTSFLVRLPRCAPPT